MLLSSAELQDVVMKSLVEYGEQSHRLIVQDAEALPEELKSSKARLEDLQGLSRVFFSFFLKTGGCSTATFLLIVFVSIRSCYSSVSIGFGATREIAFETCVLLEGFQWARGSEVR